MARTVAITLSGTLLLSMLQSCSIAPIQEDVTGISTPIVVRRIRCEMRDAIRGQIGGYLLALKADSVAHEIGEQLRDRERPLKAVELRRLTPGQQERIASFKDYAVTYDFTFNGKISNNLDGDLTAVDTFISGNRAWPFTAKLDRSRQNIQTFRQTDRFGDLLTAMPKGYCPDPHANQPRNYVYPIVGTIGLAQQLRDFISLNQLSNLSPAPNDTNGPPVFVSKITFTTTIQGTVDPTVSISAVVGQTTSSGGYGLSSERTDVHEVIVGFAASTRKLKPSETEAFIAAFDERLPKVAQSRARTAEEKASEDAVNNSIVRFDFGRQPGAVIINRNLSIF